MVIELVLLLWLWLRWVNLLRCRREHAAAQRQRTLHLRKAGRVRLECWLLRLLQSLVLPLLLFRLLWLFLLLVSVSCSNA
jgi:hypothetical protein